MLSDFMIQAMQLVDWDDLDITIAGQDMDEMKSFTLPDGLADAAPLAVLLGHAIEAMSEEERSRLLLGHDLFDVYETGPSEDTRNLYLRQDYPEKQSHRELSGLNLLVFSDRVFCDLLRAKGEYPRNAADMLTLPPAEVEHLLPPMEWLLGKTKLDPRSIPWSSNYECFAIPILKVPTDVALEYAQRTLDALA